MTNQDHPKNPLIHLVDVSVLPVPDPHTGFDDQPLQGHVHFLSLASYVETEVFPLSLMDLFSSPY